MNWSDFIFFALSALLFWIGGACCAYFPSTRKMALSLTLIGLLVFAIFIACFWINIERPPLRTMGETRLWYSFFLSLAGFLVYYRYSYTWVLSFSTVLSGVFIFVNWLQPEIHDTALMPVLQSIWFAPHVIVYMFSYALMGVSMLISVYALIYKVQAESKKIIYTCDTLTRIGLAFLTIGMLFGSLWAKQAWGHYWGWDPKETWAFATFLAYLFYIHLRLAYPQKKRLAFGIQIVAFLLLQVCWYGVQYLPSAIGRSIHVY
ncbi:MAG: cytochrome c biogenesis protein CcsA [Bacteroidales bacterium]